jgi:hypothetical protein
MLFQRAITITVDTMPRKYPPPPYFQRALDPSSSVFAPGMVMGSLVTGAEGTGAMVSVGEKEACR